MNILTVSIIYFIRCLRRDNKVEERIIEKERIIEDDKNKNQI